MLRLMGSQRVGHDCDWTELKLRLKRCPQPLVYVWANYKSCWASVSSWEKGRINNRNHLMLLWGQISLHVKCLEWCLIHSKDSIILDKNLNYITSNWQIEPLNSGLSLPYLFFYTALLLLPSSAFSSSKLAILIHAVESTAMKGPLFCLLLFRLCERNRFSSSSPSSKLPTKGNDCSSLWQVLTLGSITWARRGGAR